MVPVLADYLRALPARLDTPYIFTGMDGGPRRSVRTAFANTVERAALNPARDPGEDEAGFRARYLRDRVTPHTLRHSWATTLAEHGVDRHDLKRWGGWTQDTTVSRYVDEARTTKRQVKLVRIDEIRFFEPTPEAVDVAGRDDGLVRILVRLGQTGARAVSGA